MASDFQSPRTAALGGAGHASPMLNDSIYLNPSFVSFMPSYSFSANYSFFKGPPACEDCGPSDPHGHALNVSIQDGRSELFQAGVGVTLLDDRKALNIGASRAIVQQLGIGIGGKWILPETESPDLKWDSLASITFLPMDWLQLAAIVDNVFQYDENIPFGLYREYILATKFNAMNIVLVYLDPHLAPSAPDSFGHEAGLEFPVMSDFFFRVGHFRNANVPAANVRGTGFSTGLGWVAPASSFDFGFQRMLDPTPCNLYSFAITAFF
jgi:hypothetical protein